MPDSILSGRWKVYYLVENRQKRLWRDTAVTPTVFDTVKEVYEACNILFDNQNQMDDGTVIKYATPTEYTIGIIDAGDKEPWFVDHQSAEYMQGSTGNPCGALETSGWKRVTTTNTGIVSIQRSGTNIVEADIGNTIVHDVDSDSGTLLDVQGTTLWIRPASNAAANDWDSTSGGITCNGHTDAQTAAALTGDLLWANPYSLTPTLQGDTLTHLYAYQDGTKVSAYKGSWNWWGDGHIDILLQVKKQGAGDSALIDDGFIAAYAKRYSREYSYYLIDLSAGGRQPLVFAVGDDINNDTGYKSVTLGTSSGNWNEGDELSGKVSDARAVLTSTSGANPTITLRYYLIDDLTDFNGSEGIENLTDTGDSSTSGATSAYGPEALSGLSITHGTDNTLDIDEDGTDEYYSVVIDCSDELLADVIEWTKYITRRGSVDTGNNDGINGEAYIGTSYSVVYTSITGSLTNGDVVTQVTSGATGQVVAHHATPKILVLRATRGIFDNTNNIEKDGGNYVTGPTCLAITPNAKSAYGNFAGGRWFLPRGHALINVNSADYNNWETVCDEGTVRAAPIKVDAGIGNTRIDDYLSMFRLTAAGGIVKKDSYTVDSGQGGLGSTTLKVDPAITADETGKTTGGTVSVVDVSAQWEHRYRFLSWTGDTFTLFSLAATADAGGSQTTLVDADGDFIANGVKVGDIAYNVTEDAYAYVTAVAAGQLTTENIGSDKEIDDWSSDQYNIGGTVSTYTTSDTVYVAIMNVVEDTGTDGSPGSHVEQIVYLAPIPVQVRVRQAGDIVTFVVEDEIGASGKTVNVIRSPDTVHGT